MGLVLTFYILAEIVVIVIMLGIFADKSDSEVDEAFEDLNIFGTVFLICLYLPWIIIIGIIYGICKLFTWHPTKKEKNKEQVHIDLKI